MNLAVCFAVGYNLQIVLYVVVNGFAVRFTACATELENFLDNTRRIFFCTLLKAFYRVHMHGASYYLVAAGCLG